MPEHEQPVQHPAGERPSRDGAQRPKGQRVLDVVDQRRPGVADWLDPVRVLPPLERPGDLHVGELLPLDEVAMQGFPPRLDWPSSELERQPAAVADAAMTRNDAQVLPGRCKPLERTGAGMPGKQGGGGSIDDRSLLVDWHVNSGPQRRLGRRIARIWRVPANTALQRHLSRGVLGAHVPDRPEDRAFRGPWPIISVEGAENPTARVRIAAVECIFVVQLDHGRGALEGSSSYRYARGPVSCLPR